MKVITFDIKRGIYNFILDELETEFHAHPAVEIIIAKKGLFSIETPDEMIPDLDFVIIDSNLKHRVFSKNCHVQLLMFESYNSLFFDFLKQKGIELEDGIFVRTNGENNSEFFNEMLSFGDENNLKEVAEVRTEICLKTFETENLEYQKMLEILKSKVFLSESRLSHVFKKEIGVSLKKYLVWNRLKKVVSLVLNENYSLIEASNEVGFYDQAHLSKSFKNILGISPSKAYNSRTLQV